MGAGNEINLHRPYNEHLYLLISKSMETGLKQQQMHLPEASDLPKWQQQVRLRQDRKSTRLNSSHVRISYAVFCLKKKKNISNSAQNNDGLISRTLGASCPQVFVH